MSKFKFLKPLAKGRWQVIVDRKNCQSKTDYDTFKDALIGLKAIYEQLNIDIIVNIDMPEDDYKKSINMLPVEKPIKQIVVNNYFEYNTELGIIVDDKYKYILEQYRFNLNGGYYRTRYPLGNGKNDDIKLNKIIKVFLEGEEFYPRCSVIYLNGKSFDNRVSNLKVNKPGDTTRSKKKQTGTSSIYLGVSLTKNKNYKAEIQRFKFYASYEKEIHAAWQYNLWVDEYNIDSEKNDIEEPTDFIPYEKIEKKGNYQKFISDSHNSGFNVSYHRYRNYHSNLEDAIKDLESRKEQYKNYQKSKELYNLQKIIVNIPRNENNIAYIPSIEKGEIKNILLDDEDYIKLNVKKVTLSMASNYPFIRYNINNNLNIKIDTVRFRLNRYLKKFDETKYDVVDHINRNKLDNRKINLKPTTHLINARNKSVSKNATSQYHDVSWYKRTKKWGTYIRVDGILKHLGYYYKEDDAAIAHDLYILNNNLKGFPLNFPELE
jgi:hypothetical protein